jgi:hypothetical protein
MKGQELENEAKVLSESILGSRILKAFRKPRKE